MDTRCPDGTRRDSCVRVESPFGRWAGALSPIREETLAECVLLTSVSGSAPVRVVVVVLVVVVEFIIIYIIIIVVLVENPVLTFVQQSS